MTLAGRRIPEALIADSMFNARQSAVIYTRLGDREAALKWLEQAAADDYSAEGSR